MRESKQEFAASEKYAREGARAFPMGAMCANCGKPWARHCGTDCINGSTMTFALAEDATATMTPTLDKLEEAKEYWDAFVGALPTVAEVPIFADAAMIARDGPARPPYCTCRNAFAMGIVHRTDGPCFVIEETVSTAKPAISGLQRVYSNTHLLGSYR